MAGRFGSVSARLGRVWCIWHPSALVDAVQLPLRALESRGSLRDHGCLACSSLPALSSTLTICTASMGLVPRPFLDTPTPAPGRPSPDPHSGDVPTAKAGMSPSPTHPPTHRPQRGTSPPLPGQATPPDAGDRKFSLAVLGMRLKPSCGHQHSVVPAGPPWHPGFPAARPNPSWAPAQMPRSGRGTAVISG